MVEEVDFMLADKHKSFQQGDTITLGVRSQAGAKYSKQVYNIFAVFQGKREG